jgi:hypothetical protein
MSSLALALSLVLASISPLGDDELAQWRAVDETVAMTDEPLLPIMLEHVAKWTNELGDAPIRLSFDRDAMLEEPGRYRGELFRLTGVVQQHATLKAGEIGVRELFLRDERGEPLVIYLPIDAQSPPGEGRSAVVIARFVKIIEEPARDGRTYRYPAFVGRIFAAPPAAGAGFGALPLVALPVGVLLVIFTFLFLFTRRRRSVARAARGPSDPLELDDVDESAALPDDPAEAMAELRRRAQT